MAQREAISTLDILIVEDDREYASVVSRWLQDQAAVSEISLGLEVAPTLSVAVERIHRRTPDCMLLDLRLPEDAGLRTLLRMHEAVPTVPVVVLTQTNDPSMAQKTLRAGAQDYLVKSELDERQLLSVVQAAIERNRHLVRAIEQARKADLGRAELAALDSIRPGHQDSSDLSHGQFERLRDEYVSVLEETLYERTYRVADGVARSAIEPLAAELAVMAVTPREIVDLHTSAVRELAAGATPERFQATMQEGRLTLLELMGRVLEHYRVAAFGQSSGENRTRG